MKCFQYFEWTTSSAPFKKQKVQPRNFEAPNICNQEVNNNLLQTGIRKSRPESGWPDSGLMNADRRAAGEAEDRKSVV